MGLEVLEGAREGLRPPASTVTVELHGTRMAVWNVPTPIVLGSTFNPRIGVSCDRGCDLSKATVEVLDAEGRTVATGTLGPLTWEGTKDLYWAEVEMKAPEDEAYHQWSARFPESQVVGAQHSEANQPFALRTTRPPQCTITLGVTDEATKEPIENAYVRFGLYTSYTDGSGTAKVSLPKDKYDFVVWKTRHKIHRTTVEVAKDEDLKVELVGCKVCHGLA